MGPFIADFCCMEVGLIVELDGGQHAERVKADEERTAFLEAQGFRVLRFWNDAVLRDTEVVLARIADAVEQCRREGRRYGSGGRVDRPHPHPLPSGRGDRHCAGESEAMEQEGLLSMCNRTRKARASIEVTGQGFPLPDGRGSR
jgi:hypothetical protein